MVVVTDGQSPIETEDWEEAIEKLNGYDVQLTIV